MRLAKRMMALAALGVALALPAQAQEETTYQPYPHWMIGVQGGGQTVFTNFDNSKLITPTASAYVGYWFTPVVGARLHANGIWNKGGVSETGDKYKYKYTTGDIDLMINLVTLFGKKDYYPLNLYLIGGAGATIMWNNGQANSLVANELDARWTGKKWTHNARVGMQLDWNLCRNLSLNLEVAANSLKDKFNSKANKADDWQLTAQLGLAVKFGHKKIKAAPLPVIVEEPKEEWATRIDTTWYDDVEYVDVERERDIKKEIFFGLASDEIGDSNTQIQAVADFLKNVKNAEITITSYADKGTGTAKANMRFSKKRAESTKRQLIEKGVDPSIIKTVEWKGDTVQPYAENDKNRLSVITGRGVYTDKDRVVTKKFRTEQVRYRVR